MCTTTCNEKTLTVTHMEKAAWMTIHVIYLQTQIFKYGEIPEMI